MAKLDKAKVKLIGALVLIAVVLVIVFQNTEPVATRLLRYDPLWNYWFVFRICYSGAGLSAISRLDGFR